MVSNIAQFNKAVTRWAKDKPPEAVVQLQRLIVFEALKRIVLRTPVDTGRARGNWQVTIGSPATTSLVSQDSAGGGTIANGVAVVTNLPPFAVVYISNNVQYIEVLEYGGFVPANPGPSRDKRLGRKGRILVKGGYSIQAPHGMVEVTVHDLSTMFVP